MKGKHKKLKFLLIVLILFLIGLETIARIIIYPPNVPSFTMSSNIKDPNNDSHNPLSFEDLDLTMKDGYRINGTMVWSDKNSKKFVIYSHGWTNNRKSGLKYLDPYLDNNYNFYMYDLRGCGENSPYKITMGEMESSDLIEIIEDIRSLYGDDIKLALHGESLGSFTSMMVLKDVSNIEFCVSDCGYSSIEDVITSNLKEHHIPGFIYHPLSQYVRLRFKENWHDFDARTSLSQSKTPLLLMQGMLDETVHPWMTEALYKSSIASIKEVHYFEDAAHVKSQKSEPIRYKKIMIDFIDRVERQQ